MTLRRWLVVVTLIAVVLSTIETGSFTPRVNPKIHFRYAILGHQGTPLYLFGQETHEQGFYHLSLINQTGWGIHYLDDADGRRIFLSDGSLAPYEEFPALWLKKSYRRAKP